MAVYANLNSFNAGELSPKMIGRSDVSQYGKGCRKLQNFLVTPYGAVERRPGTKFLSMTKYPEKNLRLIRFVFSSETAYVCEFGDFYIRFFKDDSPVMTDEGEITLDAGNDIWIYLGKPVFISEKITELSNILPEIRSLQESEGLKRRRAAERELFEGAEND